MNSRTALTGLLCFLVFLTILTYLRRAPTGDDAWFAEQSYWLLNDGIIRSEFFTGINDWDKELLVSHKLFLGFGALLMHWFGFDLPVVQFSGLLFFLVLIGELTGYLRLRGEKWSSLWILALLILIFSNRLLVKMSFQNRPEMMLAAFGFGSFLLLFTSGKQNWKSAAAGIVGGMAFLAHMNGVIYLIGGFLTLLIVRNYRQLVLFSVFGLSTCSLYLIDIINKPNGLIVWLFQFTNDPAASHGLTLAKKVLQLLTFPRIFVHSPEQFALTLLFLFVVWTQRRLLNQIPRFLKIYSLNLLFVFWIISKGNSAMYMVLFIPFMLAILYEVYRLSPFVNRPVQGVFGVYLFIGVFGMGQLIYNNWKFRDLTDAYARLDKHLPEEGTGLVPLTFFFNEYEEYEQLIAHENYKLQYDKKNLSAGQMAHWGNSMEVDFIVYDYEFLAEDFYPLPGQKKLPHFNLTYFDGRFAVYRKKG